MLSSNNQDATNTTYKFPEFLSKAMANVPVSIATALTFDATFGGGTSFALWFPMSLVAGPLSQLSYDVTAFTSLKKYAYPAVALTTVATTFILLHPTEYNLKTVSELAKFAMVVGIPVQVTSAAVTNTIMETVAETAVDLFKNSKSMLQKFNLFSSHPETENKQQEALPSTRRMQKKLS